MDKITLKAEKRIETGKGAARSLRRQGLLPAVLYIGSGSTPIKLNRKEIAKLMSSGAAERTLITMELKNNGGTTEHLSLIKDYDVDPVRNELLHVDFMEISMEKKIKITIPVIITKEPIGIKKGGIMQQIMREILIECLPTSFPDKIELDASALEIGHSLHVSDIAVPEGIKLMSDSHAVIVTVSAPAVEEVAPAAAAAPVEGAPAEPELIKKTKTKEEQAEEEAKPQKEQKAKEK